MLVKPTEKLGRVISKLLPPTGGTMDAFVLKLGTNFALAPVERDNGGLLSDNLGLGQTSNLSRI